MVCRVATSLTPKNTELKYYNYEDYTKIGVVNIYILFYIGNISFFHRNLKNVILGKTL